MSNLQQNYFYLKKLLSKNLKGDNFYLINFFPMFAFVPPQEVSDHLIMANMICRDGKRKTVYPWFVLGKY